MSVCLKDVIFFMCSIYVLLTTTKYTEAVSRLVIKISFLLPSYFLNLINKIGINLIEITNKMQLCRTIYYFIVFCLLNMFRAILLLIIRSF
jgi:hypothetical protein